MKVFLPLDTGGLVIGQTPADLSPDPASPHSMDPEEQAASSLVIPSLKLLLS